MSKTLILYLFLYLLSIVSCFEDDSISVYDEHGHECLIMDNHTLICHRHLNDEGEVIKGKITCDDVEGEWENAEEDLENWLSPAFWIDVALVMGIVMGAGLMSGLTIGLMGLDMTNLEILSKSGTLTQRRHANKIIPLIKRHHLLLVTLLLMNALAMEALPIFLERLVPPVLAVIFSVTLILMFGEVIPQALCNRYALAIGAYTSWFVWVLIVLTFPISWPISKALDCILGHDHGTFFKRAELKELVSIHEENDNATKHHPFGEGLTYDEVTIIRGAIDLKNKTVMNILTPMDECFMLDASRKMNMETLQEIVDAGHSRIPVYRDHREFIIGMILVKYLVLLDPDDEVPISELQLRRIPLISSTMPLYNVLNIFQTGKSHLALIVDEADHVTPLGLITLEDVIEELIQEQIADETDKPLNDSDDDSEQLMVDSDGEVTLAFDDDFLSF